MNRPARESLAERTLTLGRGHRYLAVTDGMPLSLKSVFNGRARYTFDRRECTVDDGGWLVLNDGQPHSIEIASITRVETFIVWFPTYLRAIPFTTWFSRATGLSPRAWRERYGIRAPIRKIREDFRTPVGAHSSR